MTRTQIFDFLGGFIMELKVTAFVNVAVIVVIVGFMVKAAGV